MTNENEFESDYLNWFSQRKLTFTGINAGDYLDKEDFETYGKWAENLVKELEQRNKVLEEALQVALNNWEVAKDEDGNFFQREYEAFMSCTKSLSNNTKS